MQVGQQAFGKKLQTMFYQKENQRSASYYADQPKLWLGIQEIRSFSMKTVSARQLLITFVPSLSILVAILVVSILFQVSMPTMTQDVTAIAKLHPLSGILSNLGILLWCAAASVCLFTATIHRNVKPRDTFWFLLSSALLSAYLLFDDFFQFHEVLASRYLGLNEKVVYAALGIAVSAYLIAYRRMILRTNFGILLSGLGFLSTSVVIDAIPGPWLWRLGDWEYFLEDGAKWLGIASWCSYYVHTSHQCLVSSLRLPNNAIQPDACTSRHGFPTLERGIHGRNNVA